MGRMVMKMEQERSHFDQNDQGADECKLQKRDSGMQKVYQALPFVVLIGMLVFFGIWQAVSEKRAYSASERRLLAKRPVLTAQSIFDTSFMSDYEEYLTDQFPMRDQWITMKTYCGLLLGRRESGGVYIARDRTPYARRGSGGDGRAKYGGPAGIFERHAGGRSGAGTCDACTDCGQYMEE